MTSPTDTIRAALEMFPITLRDHALAALTELEQQLADANRRIEVLEIMDMTATAQQWEMGMKHEKARAEAAEADRDRLADTLRETLGVAEWMSGSADFSPEGQAHEGWVKAQPVLDAARAALGRHTTPLPTDRRRGTKRDLRATTEALTDWPVE